MCKPRTRSGTRFGGWSDNGIISREWFEGWVGCWGGEGPWRRRAKYIHPPTTLEGECQDNMADARHPVSSVCTVVRVRRKTKNIQRSRCFAIKRIQINQLQNANSLAVSDTVFSSILLFHFTVNQNAHIFILIDGEHFIREQR